MKWVVLFLSLFFSITLFADESQNANKLFESIFSEWTDAFNHQKLDQSCQLFSKSVIANYQGIPEKNYAAICDGFKKIFSMRNRRYEYHYQLHQVYQSEHLAAVRITWYLKLYEDGKLKESTQDEGLDIFKKNSQAIWQIVNYIAYPVG